MKTIPLSLIFLLLISGCVNTNQQQNQPIQANFGDTHVCTQQEKRAEICTMDYSPVCGSDGKTYGNGCSACAAGVDSWGAGQCEGEVIEYIDFTPQQAKKLIEETPEIIIIDVSPHYANGHLPGAINYYVGDGSLDRAIPTLDPQSTYLVYCHVDSAAILGAQKLIDAGFKNVYRLEGNYQAWTDAGYEIEK